MKTFVIGDIQGCYKGLQASLEKAKFKPHKHKLIGVGDIVARGEDSLNTVLMLMDMGDGFDTVLGNHDLHLIAIAHGIKSPKEQDKLGKLIRHKKFPKIIDWLLSKPLALKIKPKTLVVHAGLYPAWSLKQAKTFSDRIQENLQGKKVVPFLKSMYGNLPDRWEKGLEETAENRFIINAMTRMRYVTSDQRLEFSTKCHPNAAPAQLIPWFKAENEKLKPSQRIIFGHWASLNGLMTHHHKARARLIGLDTGYVWGNQMTLIELEKEKLITVDA